MENQSNQNKTNKTLGVSFVLPIGAPVYTLYSFPANYSLDDMYKLLWSKKYIRVNSIEIQVKNIVAIEIKEVK